MNGQAEAKSDTNSVATLNMHDSWLRTFQECEPPKSSRSPRKSTKSWDPWSVQLLTKAAQSLKRVHRMGKVGPTEPRGVEGTYQNSRCASREKTWVQSTKKLNENWDSISLVFLSAVLREFYQLPEHIAQFEPYYAFKRIESATPTKQVLKCTIGYDGGLVTWISAKPTDWTPEVNYHISWKMEENPVLCGELRAPRCPGFYRLVLHALLHLRLRHRYRRTMKFIMCPATIQSDNNSEQA